METVGKFLLGAYLLGLVGMFSWGGILTLRDAREKRPTSLDGVIPFVAVGCGSCGACFCSCWRWCSFSWGRYFYSGVVISAE